jgi:predicted Zn-dependent protease
LSGFRGSGSALLPYRLSVLLLALALFVLPGRASADVGGGGVSIIRDTEIENTIRVYMAPVFRVAGIDSASVQIFLINDSHLNAFVAGGMKIFIHTGLLQAATTPSQVIGVLAHETGHIVGGHLSRIREGMRAATTQAIIASVLGGAAAVASGHAEGVGAALLGGSEVGQRSILSYTRGMEQSADQAAVKFLNEAHLSARGLLEFMKKLQSEEAIYGSEGDPYLRSHPLTADRVRFVENAVENSPYSDVPTPPNLIAAHARMHGKLNGFLNPPADTLSRYSASDPTMEAKYARAIAFMRLSETGKALAIMDPLIKQSPKDPFLYELRGDILKDAGRMPEAMASYKAAVAILPWAALIRISLAQTEIEQNESPLLADAIVNLKEAIRYESQVPFAWRELAIAYGRSDKHGLASHALAEEAILNGDYRNASRLSLRAMKVLPEGTPEWLRSQDIEMEARRLKKDREG